MEYESVRGTDSLVDLYLKVRPSTFSYPDFISYVKARIYTTYPCVSEGSLAISSFFMPLYYICVVVLSKESYTCYFSSSVHHFISLVRKRGLGSAKGSYVDKRVVV